MTTTTSETPPARTKVRPQLIIAVLCFGALSAALMQTLVLPIQIELPQLLHASASDTSWIVTATLLGGGVAMPVSGRLGDIVGKQRVLVGSSVILVAGSVLCALSTSVWPMIGGRFLQGIAMGFIPVAISMVREVVPPQMASTAIATLSATMGVGGAIGLPLAAWLAQDYNWHTLFWVSAALAVVMVATSALFVPNVADGHPASIDVVGAISLAIGLIATLVGISKGNDWGWASANTLLCVVGGVVVLLLFGVYELRQDDPLVDLRTTARRPVLLTNLAALLIGFGMMAQSIVVPQLLEMPKATGYGLGQSILEAGLWMAPGGLMMMFLAPVSSKLMTTVGARITLVIGAGVLGLGYLVALFMMSAPWQLLVASCISMAGVGIGYAAMPTLILENVPPSESGSGVGINTVMRSVGTTIAGAVMASLLTSRTITLAPGTAAIPSQDAFRLCFLVGAVAALAGGAIALTISGRRRKQPIAVVEDLALSET
ncbi:MFS transporter [Flexivirga oryzae]|uniref:MFS family permease n=1 Tax=Flexivirga oryzae TaxID=1794944 RepID=A0A839NAG6_9MICO|nr:MFS transporter [Flexivirga oryzae]MBB2893193.1 MFS family permease [Flexivirga oryzae]